MTVNRKALAEAERALRRQSMRAAEELRALRIRSDLSQAAVAREVGVARSVLSRLEAGDPGITLRTRFRVATVLGADLRISAFVESGPLVRDRAQAPIVEWILTIAGPFWRRRVEAAVPGAGRRSVDLCLASPRAIVLIEVETRVGSLEEIIRELHSKREALAGASLNTGELRPIFVVLGLPRTRHHAAIVRDLPRTIAAAFPAPSSRARSSHSRHHETLAGGRAPVDQPGDRCFSNQW